MTILYIVPIILSMIQDCTADDSLSWESKMLNTDKYIDTIDTIYPDGYARESLFRSAGDMLDPGLPLSPARGLLGRLLDVISTWREKRAGRLALRELTGDQLHDIGVTRQEAEAEIAKSFFWD